MHYDITGQLVEDRRRQFEDIASRRRLSRLLRRARRVDQTLVRVKPAAVEEAPITTAPDREIDVVEVVDVVVALPQ